MNALNSTEPLPSWQEIHAIVHANKDWKWLTCYVLAGIAAVSMGLAALPGQFGITSAVVEWQVLGGVLSAMAFVAILSIIRSLKEKWQPGEWERYQMEWSTQVQNARQSRETAMAMLKKIVLNINQWGLKKFEFELWNCDDPFDADFIFLGEVPHGKKEIRFLGTYFLRLLQRDNLVVLLEGRNGDLPEDSQKCFGWEDGVAWKEASAIMRRMIKMESITAQEWECSKQKRNEGMMRHINTWRRSGQRVLIWTGDGHLIPEVLDHFKDQKVAIFKFEGEDQTPEERAAWVSSFV